MSGGAHAHVVLMRLSFADGRVKDAKISGFRMLKRIYKLMNSVIVDSVIVLTKTIGITVANEGREG